MTPSGNGSPGFDSAWLNSCWSCWYCRHSAYNKPQRRGRPKCGGGQHR